MGGPCGSPTRTASTSQRPGRRSSTSSTTTWPSARASSTPCRERPCMMHRFPTGLSGEKVHQKRVPAGRTAVAGDRAPALPALRPPRRRALRDRAGRRDLGGPDVDRRVPPVELATRRRGEARRVADRPRPDAGLPARQGPAGRRRRPRGARRAGRGRLAEDVGRQRDAHLRAHRAVARVHRRAGGGTGVRPRGRTAGADGRHDHLVAQGPGPDGGVRGLQPERP